MKHAKLHLKVTDDDGASSEVPCECGWQEQSTRDTGLFQHKIAPIMQYFERSPQAVDAPTQPHTEYHEGQQE